MFALWLDVELVLGSTTKTDEVCSSVGPAATESLLTSTEAFEWKDEKKEWQTIRAVDSGL